MKHYQRIALTGAALFTLLASACTDREQSDEIYVSNNALVYDELNFSSWHPVLRDSIPGEFSVDYGFNQSDSVIDSLMLRFYTHWWEYPGVKNKTTMDGTIINYKDNNGYTIEHLTTPRECTLLSDVFYNSLGVPLDFVPSGRKNGSLVRDQAFEENARKLVDEELSGQLENTFFINFTGHMGVLAPIAEYGVPVHFHLPMDDRPMNQMQDYASTFSKHEESTSIALVLESNHGFGQWINPKILPDSDKLKQYGINNIVVFTENLLGYESTLPFHAEDGDFPFFQYLEGIQQAGISIRTYGLEHDPREPLAPIERPKDYDSLEVAKAINFMLNNKNYEQDDKF